MATSALQRRLGYVRRGAPVLRWAPGAIQFAALATERAIRLPLEWSGRSVRIAWLAPDSTALYYLFAREAEPLPTIDDATSSTAIDGGPAHTVIARAPSWIPSRSARWRRVPDFGEPALLLLKPSAGAGRVSVRLAPRS